MEESLFSGESSEPPSTGLEHDDPPGNSGNTSVLTVAEDASQSKHFNTPDSSVLNLVRSGRSPAARSRQKPANGKHVTEKVTTSPALPDRNGVRLDTAHTPGSSPRKENLLTSQFRERFYPDASDADWDDWRWQSRHRIKTLEQFERIPTTIC